MGGAGKALSLGALVLALSSSGCRQDTIATIISKQHEPERVYLGGVLEHRGIYSRVVPGPVVDDEDFIFKITKENGETVTIYVPKETYNSLNVGDKIDTREIPHETSDPD